MSFALVLKKRVGIAGDSAVPLGLNNNSRCTVLHSNALLHIRLTYSTTNNFDSLCIHSISFRLKIEKTHKLTIMNVL